MVPGYPVLYGQAQGIFTHKDYNHSETPTLYIILAFRHSSSTGNQVRVPGTVRKSCYVASPLRWSEHVPLLLRLCCTSSSPHVLKRFPFGQINPTPGVEHFLKLVFGS